MFSNKPNYAVIRSTTTPADMPISVDTLLEEELNAGKDGIGYHYYIRRDGSLTAHRPLHQRGNHTAGYNRISVGILYEGGVDSFGANSNTMTTQQKARLDQLMKWLRSVFGNIEELYFDE